MKTVFNFILLAALAESAVAQKSTPLQRLAALVDYIAADYPGAVKDGKVLAESEYAEQKGMVKEARTVSGAVTAPAGRDAARPLLNAKIDQLEKDVLGLASEQVVAADCRAIHAQLLDDYGL